MKPLNQIAPVFLIPALFAVGVQNAYPDSVEFKPAELNFRSVQMDNSCKPNKLKVINIGQTSIEKVEFELDGPKVFRIQKRFKKCTPPLNPGDVCQIYIDFCPDGVKNYEAILTISGSSQELVLKGRGKTGKN